MSFCSLQQSRIAKRGYMPLPVNTDNSDVHRIRRLNEWVEQNTEPIDNSVQKETNPPCPDDNSDKKELHGHISCRKKPALDASSCENKTRPHNSSQIKISAEEFKYFPRFGPSYVKDTYANRKYKENAWNQIVKKTPGEGEESAVYLHYLAAIKRIEKEAKETYDPSIVDGLKRSEFQQIMLIDGCYFLQLALCILGGPKCPKLLGYPGNHPGFGTADWEERTRWWIQAMFFVGNQIPYVVIRELMKQRFFQDVIKEGKKEKIWRRPSDLPKPYMVLYLLVVEPELEKNGPRSSGLFSNLRKPPREESPSPSHLLHRFHCHVLGPGSDPLDSEAFDLEAGTKDHDEKFPSATEVEKVGVALMKANQGIREIQFSNSFYFFPHLYVPPITFDGDTELMFQYIKRYEIEQNISKSKREVAAYLRFMSDLIQTANDVNILESRGIIKLKKQVNKDELPAMLNKLGSSEEISLTQNLRLARKEIINYSTTTRNLISIAAIAFILTVVQTVYTLLAYYYPRN